MKKTDSDKNNDVSKWVKLIIFALTIKVSSLEKGYNFDRNF